MNNQSESVRLGSKNPPTLREKRFQFAEEIRKKQRSSWISEKRKCFLNQNQKQEDKKMNILKDLLNGFGLQYDPKFTAQSLQHNQYHLIDIFLQKKESLIRVSFKKNNSMDQIDEKTLPKQQSALELQPSLLPKQYPLQIHTMLYQSIADDMLINQGKYQSMEKDKQLQLIKFWLQFLKRNKYTETMLNKDYHLAIIHLLGVFVTKIQSPDVGEKILLWVGGVQSLGLVFNCLTGMFLDCFVYERVYEIIVLGLKSAEIAVKRDSIDVLLKCIRVSDFDDIANLLQHKPQVFISLCQLFNTQQFWTNTDYIQQTNSNETTNSLIKAGFCLTLFLWTYDENILACLKQGAGYIAARLICTKNAALIKQGLTIFDLTANIQQKQYAKQAQVFLIMNTSIRDTGVWWRLASTFSIIGHLDSQVREKFVSFINSFLCNAELNEICLLLNEFQFPERRSLVGLLVDLFMGCEVMQVEMMNSILMIIQSLLYYNRECDDDEEDDMDEMGMEMGMESMGRLRLSEEYRKSYIVEAIYSSGMVTRMMELANNQRTNDELKDKLDPLLDYLSKQNKMESL